MSRLRVALKSYGAILRRKVARMAVTLEHVQKSISSLIRQNKFYSLIYSLIVPLLVGVYSNFYADLVKINPLLFWLPITLFVAYAVASAYFTYDIVLAPEVYTEMVESRQQIHRLENTTKFLSALQEQALILGSMVRKKSREKPTGTIH